MSKDGKQGLSHYFHLHAQAPPAVVPGCVDERMASLCWTDKTVDGDDLVT